MIKGVIKKTKGDLLKICFYVENSKMPYKEIYVSTEELEEIRGYLLWGG